MKGDRVLTTHRLLLKPFAGDQVDALHGVFADAGVRRYLLDDQVVTRDWVVEEVAQSEARFKSQGCGLWAIVPADSDLIVGFCGYRHFHEPPELQLVCGLAPAWWGRGLAAEAACEVVRYGFEVLGFEQIVADTDAGNTASVRLMERLGMRFRERVRKSGLDTLCHVLWRQEWDSSCGLVLLGPGGRARVPVSDPRRPE